MASLLDFFGGDWDANYNPTDINPNISMTPDYGNWPSGNYAPVTPTVNPLKSPAFDWARIGMGTVGGLSSLYSGIQNQRQLNSIGQQADVGAAIRPQSAAAYNSLLSGNYDAQDSRVINDIQEQFKRQGAARGMNPIHAKLAAMSEIDKYRNSRLNQLMNASVAGNPAAAAQIRASGVGAKTAGVKNALDQFGAAIPAVINRWQGSPTSSWNEKPELPWDKIGQMIMGMS